MIRLLCLFLLLFVVACADDDEAPLEGERISILEMQKSLQPEVEAENATAFELPQAWSNQYWPQSGGYPNHSMQHLALSDAPKLAWSRSIGQGGSKDIPLTAPPIVVEGTVFTLDAKLKIRAFNAADGAEKWVRSVRPEEEDDIALGGGLAFGKSHLYATNGYNEVWKINPGDGSVIWRKTIPTPIRAAPSYLDGRLYLSTIDSRIFAMDPEAGNILWTYQGLADTSSLIGNASPALTQDMVVAGFSSGELTALRPESGTMIWSDDMTSRLRLSGIKGLADIRGLPVIDEDLVIAVSYGNTMVAIDRKTGNRAWSREIGSYNTPWLAADTIYLITNDDQAVAFNRATGQIRWVYNLRPFQEEDKDKKLVWYGPTLAGGKLYLPNNNGLMLALSPKTGELLGQMDTDKDIAMAPVVAGETLYLLSKDGTLQAWR